MLPICQEKQVLLSKQYQQNTLAHAIIIEGIKGTGKHKLAKWLLDLLICQRPVFSSAESLNTPAVMHACGQCKTCLLHNKKSYPDHLAFDNDDNTLGIDDIRKGNRFLETTPHIGSLKTLLIPNAKSMTTASANALLKTLEEPNKNTYIILITDSLDALLPTITSRCAVYSIRAKVGDDLLAALNVPNQHITSNEQAFNYGLSHHNTDNKFVNLSQLPELIDEETLNEFNQFKQYYETYLVKHQNEAELLNCVVNNQHGFRWLEKVTSNIIRHFYQVNEHETPLANNLKRPSIQSLHEIFQAIINCNKLVESYTQANRQYVGEQLVMKINNIIRPMI